MYNTRAVRDKKGRLISQVRPVPGPVLLRSNSCRQFVHAADPGPFLQDLQSKELPNTRIQPDRRWFGNTRVVGQKQLEQFRAEMANKVNDSYTVLLRERKLPLQLLEDPEKKLAGKQVTGVLLDWQPMQ